MDHNEAFLQDICTSPDDDGPRLIYADWLEEHGDPDRAAFIRTQVALARADPGDDRCADWEQTAADLLSAHRNEWLGPLRWCTTGPVFRRGFLEAVTMSAFNFLAQAPFMFRETPLREVCFDPVSVPLGELLDCPYLVLLSGLGFRRDYFSAVSEGLAASPRFAGLTSLDLGAGDEDLRVLAASGHLRRLVALELRGGSVGDEGMRALVNSPNLPPPRELGLGATRVTAEGVGVLVSSRRADRQTAGETGGSISPAPPG